MWTKEQESVIQNRGSNLLVAAAAGSGKTAVLIERIIQLILDKENPIDVDKLLVVTFTKAAASEMKERVGLAIEKALENDSDNKHLQKQMMLLNKADISTIDSFCKKVLTNNFHVTDLDPNIKIADPTEISIIASEVMKEMFEELYDQKNEKFLKLVDWYSSRNNDDSLVSLILTVNNFVNSSPYPEKWLDSSAQYFDTKDKEVEFYIKNYFIPIAKDVLMALNYHYFIVKECLGEIMPYDDLMAYYEINNAKFEYLKSVKDNLSDFLDSDKEDSIDTDKMLEIWKEILQTVEEYKGKKFKSFRKNKKHAEDAVIAYEEIKPKLDESFKSIQSEFEKLNISLDHIKKENDIVYPYMRALSDITILFREKFAKKKEAMSIVDFADIEHYALEILTDEKDGETVPSKIAKSYSDRYVEVFTDEYQDSNLVQEMILSMVSKTDKPNRFMVGDVKQSIYRFRQAMPEIFMDKYNSYDLYSESPDSLNKKIMLYKNFRSRAEILEGCNHIFSKIMRKETGELDYTEDERLNPSAEFKEMTKENAFVAGPIEIFIVDEKDDKENEDKDLSRAILNSELTNEEELEDLQGFSKECVAIANIIYKMVNSKDPQYMVFDKEIDDYRPVEYRDIVILMRSPSKKALSIEEILTEYDIPVYTDSGDGYFSTLEVDTVINLLKIIDNPIQDIPLISVMRSPIYGFSSNELAKIRLAGKNMKFYEALLNIYNLGEEKSNQSVEESYMDEESFFLEDSDENKIREDIENSMIFENESIENESIKEEKLSEEMMELKNKVTNFVDSIEYMRKKSLLLSVDEFIWDILKETGYYAYVGLLEMGQQRQDNLMLLFERARQYENSSYKGLFNFINYVERMKSKASDLGEAKSISEEENVVRVMSIHKSKGLEFPVVIVANIEKRFNTSSDEVGMSLHQIMGYGPRVNDIKRNLHFDSISKKRIDNVKKNELIAEEMRLLYVAMTRAKEKLIFTARIKDRDKKIDKWKHTPTDENLNIDSMAVLSANSYLNWIMPAIINLSEREEFISVTGEISKYIGYKNCKWSINIDDFEKVKDDYIDIMRKKSESLESKDIINTMEAASSFESLGKRIEDEEKINHFNYMDLSSGEMFKNSYSKDKEKVVSDGEDSKYIDCSYEEIKKILDSKFDYEYKYKASANKPSSISVSEIKKIIQDTEDDEMHRNIFEKTFSGELKTPKFMHKGKDMVEFTAAERGTIFHLAMQLLNFSKFNGDESQNELIEKIDEEKKSFIEKNIMTIEEAETVNSYWIARFISSPIFKDITYANNKNKVYKEKAIDYSIKINEVYKDEGISDSERMMMVGIIDLFFEDENGDLILLDYKTDYVNDKNYEEVTKRYKVQLELYKKAMEDISGRRVSKTYIYLFSIGKLVEYKEI
ncbi:MAG: UvrD-helicase domain-containing protein [Peptostreptococcus sp.]|uniref:UvrD-helicase domain-containing protein n=1 Tax=Peptostreptococcus sp. TaxID=1262 RepID=UPI002FCAF65D